MRFNNADPLHSKAADTSRFENMLLNELVEESHRMAKDKGWWDQNRPPLELLALVHSEVSEAVEELRNGHPPDELYFGPDGKPEGVPAELADVLIRIFDMCGAACIDLDEAVSAKLAFNATRPHRHGGKVA